MNKLSIFLSMIVAVAGAAFAASEVTVASGPSTKAADGSQGYWFTLTQKAGDATNRFLTIAKSEPTAAKGDLAESFFWHAQSVTDDEGTTAYYLQCKGVGYLSVSLQQKEVEGKVELSYKLTSASSTSAAARWVISTKNNGETTISLAAAPSSVKLPDAAEDQDKYTNLTGSHIYVSWSNIGLEVSLTDNAQEWTLETAETWYDAAVDAGADKLNTLINQDNPLWSTEAAKAEAQKAIDQVKDASNYAKLRSASSNILSTINSAKTTLDNAYNKLYQSVNSQVITFTNSGCLGIKNDALTEGAASDLNSFWTIAKSGNGYTFRNEYLNRYLSYIPKKDAVLEWGNEIEPAVPAHFGVSTTATVFTLKPVDGGQVELYYGDQPFAVADDIAEINSATRYTINAVSTEKVVEAVDGSGVFQTEKQAAVTFLQDFAGMIDENQFTSSEVWPDNEKNVFSHYAAVISGDEFKLANPDKATASDAIKQARQKMNTIIATVNKASTPVFFTAVVDDNETKYLSASYYTYEGASQDYQIPTVRFTDIKATDKNLRLSTALWAFEYVGEGRARFFNTEDLYLTAPYYESAQGQTTMATESQSTATLFTINGKSFAYTDKEGNNATIEVGETSDFAVANAMIAPAASDCYTDDEDIVRPEGDVTYYYIASVGGGGVIGANLPGDALTHSAPSMGSYWWLEQDLEDPEPNAYFIHSIYPGYYLGADYTLSAKPTKWYIGENSASRANNLAQIFNGYESGLLIGTAKDPSRGSVVAAAPYTNAGAANPAIQSGRFSSSNWEYTSWMFVNAGDINDITGAFGEKLELQIDAVKTALEGLSTELPFAANSLSNAIGEITIFESEAPEDVLEMAAGFNEIMALAQADFDAEVLSKVNGLTVRLINQGVQSDMNSNSYLAGSGSNLSLVGITDDSADSHWTMKANGSRGITFTNGNNRTLGSVSSNGSITSATGTYRLAIDIFWIVEDEKGNEIGTSPWYSIPEGVNKDNFEQYLSYGIGLQDINAKGLGLAAQGGNSRKLCGADLTSPYAQWRLVTYAPAPDGIDSITDDAALAEEVALYNLQGIRVNRADAAPGIYISLRADGSVVKIAIK